MPKKIVKMRFETIIWLLAVFTIGILLEQCDTNSSSINNRLKQTASEINLALPMMVDQYTQLDKVAVLPNNIFQYNYTLIYAIKDSIDLQLLSKVFEEKVRPAMINAAKTKTDINDVFRENGITLEYFYKDKNGEFVSKFTITGDEYTDK